MTHDMSTPKSKMLEFFSPLCILSILKLFCTHFSPDAHEAFKSLQGLLLEKACEGATESIEHPGHQCKLTRGSEDAMADDRQQAASVSPDDLLVRFLFNSCLM